MFVFAPAPQAVVPVSGEKNVYFPVNRVYCVGRNYADHDKEMGGTGKTTPCFFSKPADAIFPIDSGKTAQVPYPQHTENLQHEVELVVAVNKGGKDLTVEEAQACIFGWAVGVDLTRRDLQAEAKAKALAALRANPGDRAYWADLLAKVSFEVPALQALVEGKRLAAADAKPTDAAYAQAAEAFAKGDVSGAYANALASAGQAYTFDALNLAANAGRRIGKTPEAAVLALAAADLAPKSPYPWVHLAFVAKAEGKGDLCAACCDQAETLGPEDAWVRDQVKALRADLAPAAEPSETQSAGKAL